jgi:hypothetical protein
VEEVEEVVELLLLYLIDLWTHLLSVSMMNQVEAEVAEEVGVGAGVETMKK